MMRNIKKITTTIILSIVALTLVGCGNNLVKKSIEQAKTAIESKNYDKALVSLELALDEDSENKEAKQLYSIVENYQKAKKLMEENNVDESKKALDDIDAEYVNYTIKEDIESLKLQIEEKIKAIELVNSNLTKLLTLVEQKNYDGANALVEEINKSSLNEEQKGKVNELKAGIDSELAQIEAQRIAEEERKVQEQNKKVEEEQKAQNKTANIAKYSIPSLNRTANSTEELHKIFDEVGHPFDYIDNNSGSTYLFNPWSTKASSFN